jgi:ribosomal protein S18 acetylase RimI-like enzyme
VGPGHDPPAHGRIGSAKLLPDGRLTPGHHFFVALERNDESDDESDDEVGQIWLKLTGERAFAFHIGVRESFRRQGYGRAAMRLAEQWCRDRGITEIGLYVYAHNPGARTLYEELGFEETGRHLRKKL